MMRLPVSTLIIVLFLAHDALYVFFFIGQFLFSKYTDIFYHIPFKKLYLSVETLLVLQMKF